MSPLHENRGGGGGKEGEERILVVKLSSLGDILHAMPMIAPLRRRFPGAFIAWAVQVGEELLAEHPGLDAVLNVGRGRGLRGGLRWLADVRRLLRPYGFSTAVDVQGLAKSGVVAWLSGARRVVGFRGRNARELNWLFTTHRYRAPVRRHVVRQNMALLQHFGIEEEPDIPGLAVSREDEAFTAELVERILPPGTDSYIIVNPGVSRPNKRWPASHFASLCGMLRKKGGGEAVFLTAGSEEEYALCEEIRAAVPGEGIVVVPRLSLGQYAALVRKARLFVGNDTGPTHMAYAAGVPAVFLFGPTGPWRNGAYPCAHGTGINIVSPSPCIECWAKRCTKSRSCMEMLLPEQVKECIDRFRAEARPGWVRTVVPARHGWKEAAETDEEG